jgi:hypothetical protein
MFNADEYGACYGERPHACRRHDPANEFAGGCCIVRHQPGALLVARR